MSLFRKIYKTAARSVAATVTGGMSEAYLAAKKASKLPSLEQPENAPASNDADVLAAQMAEIQRRKKAIGRAATILTSGMGVLGNAPVSRKTMLGG